MGWSGRRGVGADTANTACAGGAADTSSFPKVSSGVLSAVVVGVVVAVADGEGVDVESFVEFDGVAAVGATLCGFAELKYRPPPGFEENIE